LKTIYYSQTGLLSSGEKEVLLSNQNKVCLDFFIKHEGLLVSKELIHQECWGNRGLIVSDSTVRQSLYRLRQSLKDIGLENDVLTTVGKSGYILNKGFIIIHKEGERQTPSNTTSSRFPQEAKHQDTVCSLPPVKLRGKHKHFILFTSLALIAFFVIGMTLRGMTLLHRIEYQYYVELNGSVFSFMPSAPVNKEEMIQRVVFWLNNQNVNKVERKYIYINSTRNNNLSFISCDGRLEDTQSRCSSYSVIGRGHA